MRTVLEQRKKRKLRVRKTVFGTSMRPRLSVHRSNKYIYAQIIDDTVKETLVGVSEAHSIEKEKKMTRTEKARTLGVKLAELAKKKKVTAVVFDKGSFSYHGRVKALAEGAREGGLRF